MNEESTSRRRGEQAVQYAFRPIYIMLKLFCLHTNFIFRGEHKNTTTVTVRNVLHVVYCAVIGLWMLLNTARQLYQLHAVRSFGISSSLTSSIAFVMFNVAFSMYLPVSLWKFSRYLDGLLNELQSFIERTETTVNVVCCRRIATVLMLGYMGLTVATTSAFTWSMKFVVSANTTSPLQQVFGSFGIFGIDRLPWFAMLSWHFVESTINNGIAIALMAVFIFCAFILTKCMNCLSKKMDINTTEGMSDSILRKYRREFETLVQILQQYNSCVNFYSGTVYLLELIVPCLMLYGIAHERLSRDNVLFSMSFILFAGMNLVIYIGVAIALNMAIHKPLDSLYRMNTESLSEKGVQELSLFISRLSGSPIGVSVYGLFVIDTSTVLMLIGTLATYAVVVLQFQPTVTTSDA